MLILDRFRADQGRWQRAICHVGLALAAAIAPVAAFAATAEPPLTAEAKTALEDMGRYLRGLKSFELTADGTAEARAENGQNVEFALQLHYLVQTPNRLMGEISTGARKVQMFYDGTKLTIAAPGKGYYTDAPMSGNLSTLLAQADAKYGVTLPLESLFRWGDSARPLELPTSGFKVGTAACGTAICDQYAYRQPGADWQMWVKQGASPLPVRLVFTGTDRVSRPRTTANLTWVTDTPIAADRFTFTPATGATRIAMKPASSAKTQGDK